MPAAESLAGFVVAALVVLVIPGPAVLYILATSLGQGRRAGLVSVLGLSAGALVHVAAATAGLSAILLASATAFTAIKLAGALGRIFTDGVLVSILNPKIAVFFLAFLPQFVERGRGPVPVQVLFLGLLYVGLALVTDGTYAMIAGHLRHWLSGRVLRGPVPRYASGILYIGLGIGTALTGRRA
jgi:threonine/homoserine/homoserine lactone efflux protein